MSYADKVERITEAKAARRAEIEALQRRYNVCAWCGVAPVDAGQAYCLTHAGKVPE